MDTGGTSPNYSCCDILESLMEEGRNRLYVDVEIIIKPGHIYKANHEEKASNSDQLNIQIKNAFDGMYKMMNVIIKFDKMNEDDWNYLRKQMVQDNATTCNEQFRPSSRRKALDEEVGNFLTNLGGGTSVGGTDHSGSGGSRSSQTGLTRPPRRN